MSQFETHSHNTANRSENIEELKAEILRLEAKLQNRAETLEPKALQAISRKIEKRYRLITEHAYDVIWILDTDLCFKYVSPSIERVYGYTVEEAMANSLPQIMPPESLDIILRLFSASAEKGSEIFSPKTIEVQQYRADGSLFWTEINFIFVNDSENNLIELHGLTRDVTERKQSEELLKKSSAQLENIIDQSPFAVQIAEVDGESWRLTTANRESERIFGMPEQQQLTIESRTGKYGNRSEAECFFRSLDGMKIPFGSSPLIESLNTGKGIIGRELAVVQPNGNELTVLVDSTPIIDEAGKIIAALATYSDISERKKIEEDQQRNAMGLETLAETAMALVELPIQADLYSFLAKQIVKFESVSFVSLSEFDKKKGSMICRSFEGLGPKMAKFVEIMGKNPIGTAYDLDKDISIDLLRKGRLFRMENGLYELAFRRIPKSVCKVAGRMLQLGDVYIIGFVRHERLFATAMIAMTSNGVIDRRIIETFATQASIAMQRKKDEKEKEILQSQLQQAQKMEAIGKLAGGVAHDFNNLLTGITGNIELELMSLEKNDPIRETLLLVNKTAMRAADLTRQLLAFGRKQIIEPHNLDLNELLKNVQRIIERVLGENTELKFVLSGGPLMINADPGQIEQILTNLVVNARDAMPDGGLLTIRTKSIIDLGEDYRQSHPYSPQGSCAMLEVSDTGIGMDEQMKSRVFEPFFSTKPRETGAGLGLSSVYGIVKQHKGSIEVYSEPGMGASFKLYFPAVSKRRDVLEYKNRKDELPGGDETVLVVEDEQIVRNVATKLLKRIGYTVLSAEDGMHALELADSYNKPIHLLATDVVMPKMDGRRLAQSLSESRKDMKVLFTSGYNENVIEHHGMLDENINFISKPYTPQSFARKVRDILDS